MSVVCNIRQGRGGCRLLLWTARQWLCVFAIIVLVEHLGTAGEVETMDRLFSQLPFPERRQAAGIDKDLYSYWETVRYAKGH